MEVVGWARGGRAGLVGRARWALVVFLVGFTTWMVAPAVGSAVAVVACCGAARRWARKQEARRGDLLPWGRKDSGRR